MQDQVIRRWGTGKGGEDLLRDGTLEEQGYGGGGLSAELKETGEPGEILRLKRMGEANHVDGPRSIAPKQTDRDDAVPGRNRTLWFMRRGARRGH